MPLRMRGWSCRTIPGNSRAARLRRRAILIVGAWLAGAGWMSPAEAAEEAVEADHAVPIANPTPGIHVGERLSFQGRWFGLPVGSGWIEVKELTTLQGRSVYRIDAEGSSNDLLSTFYPIHDSLRSYLDATTLQPVQFEKDQREGRYRANEIVTFDHTRHVATYLSRLNHSTKEIPIPEDVHDLVSAFYWLRTQLVEVGRPLVVDLYTDEKVYRTVFKPLKSMMLELLRRGTFPCVAVEPLASFKGILVERGRVVAYVTADERRIPLLVKIWTPWGLMTGTIDREVLQRAYGDPRGPG